jgi:hypothetical protein
MTWILFSSTSSTINLNNDLKSLQQSTFNRENQNINRTPESLQYKIVEFNLGD